MYMYTHTHTHTHTHAYTNCIYWLFYKDPGSRLASLVAQMVKHLRTMQETGFDPWVGKSPGEGNDNPLQYSSLENAMDGGAW